MLRQPFRFTFTRCLGRGGFGEVYLAYQHRPGGLVRKVAVKILKDALEDDGEEAVRRLHDEGRMLAMLDHPSIISVLELTRLGGRVALVTEYVEGIDLAARTAKGKLIPARALMGVVASVAEALDCAWTTLSPETGKPLHLIHRDIKPQNIRISRFGEVKLLDFGIARTTQMFRESSTDVGEVPFTPGYSPPESFTKGVQDAPADIYALSVTIYRLLTGQRLFRDIRFQEQFPLMGDRIRYEAFTQDRLLLVEDIDIRKLVEDMMAWDESQRPTAAEVVRRAEQLVDELEGPRLKRWVRGLSFADDPTTDEGSLTGATLDEDVAGQTISIIPGVLPGGPATLPPHAAASAELLAVAEVTSPRPGPHSLPPRERTLTSPIASISSGHHHAVPIPVLLEPPVDPALGASQSLVVNVIVALGIFVTLTVTVGIIVGFFIRWLIQSG